LLIVMRGGALLLADVERRVAAGDVVTLPGGQSYGFTDIEGDLHVLQVALGSPLQRGREPEELTLERLLALNRKRAEAILESPFYVLLRNGLLDTSEKRAAACKAIRVFSDGFQMFLFTRQAMCRDESYASEFHGHMLEELGHNDLLQVSGNKQLMNDPILRACSAWFSQQMLTLDNAEKAVVNMALETSGFHFHSLAKPIFETGEHNRYFTTHAEADEDHQDMGVDLLANLHPDVYRRLLEIMDESWDMMVAVTTRFAELVEAEVADASCAAQ